MANATQLMIFVHVKLYNPKLWRGRENMLGKFAHAKAISRQAKQAVYIRAGRQPGRPAGFDGSDLQKQAEA